MIFLFVRASIIINFKNVNGTQYHSLKVCLIIDLTSYEISFFFFVGSVHLKVQMKMFGMFW